MLSSSSLSSNLNNNIKSSSPAPPTSSSTTTTTTTTTNQPQSTTSSQQQQVQIQQNETYTFPQSVIRNLGDRKEKKRIGGEEIENLIRKLYYTPNHTSNNNTNQQQQQQNMNHATMGTTSSITTTTTTTNITNTPTTTSNTTSPLPSSTTSTMINQKDETSSNTSNNNNNINQVRQVLIALNTQFIHSVQPNMRRGGLWGLASASIALGHRGICHFMNDLIPPVLSCFADHDSKVRFHACEALYNIAKVARGHTLVFFNAIFDGLCKLSADPDNAVKNASTLLDRLMKDVATEDDHFDVEQFVPLIRERISSNNPFVRQFLVGWIMILDSVPDINMIEYLPQFLHGLFSMLSDPNKEIVQRASSVLEEFLIEIGELSDSVDLGPLVTIISSHATSEDERTRERALQWIHKFLLLGQHNKLIPYYASLVAVVLPSISHKQESIRTAAALTNKELISCIQKSQKHQIAFNELLHHLKVELEKFSVPSRVVALNWLHILLNKDMDSVMKVIDVVFILLLKTLSDPSDEVVSLDLEVLAIVSSTEQNFVKFLKNLVSMLRTDQKLLAKAGFIIRQLSVMLDPEKIYCELSKILQTYDTNLEFCSVMIQTLNMILLTSKELSELRELIKKGSSCPESVELFQQLYKSWCHNPVATLSLCLLAKNYKHACELVKTFSQIDASVSFLVQIDNLVQLIESPVFADLRLQLLEPAKEIYLLKALYGILMLLPQSTAYDKLNKRLQCVNTLALLQLIPVNDSKPQPSTERDDEINRELLTHFTVVQQKHRQSHNTEF